MADPHEDVLAAVHDMESHDGLKLVNPGTVRRGPFQADARSRELFVGVRAVSPDGTAIAYFPPLRARPSHAIPIIVESIAQGVRPFTVGEQSPYLCAISEEAKVLVVRTSSTVHLGRKSVLGLDLRVGLEIHDLTAFATTRFELTDLESISVAGTPTLAALGSREQIQVIEVPGGKEVFGGGGRFPKLSQDGKRLAYISDERLYIRSLVDGTVEQLLPGTRVMGAGAWSPNGRFLAAGAWTRRIAFEKTQIVIDTKTGQYGVINKLGDGDYGDEFAWISVKLLQRG